MKNKKYTTTKNSARGRVFSYSRPLVVFFIFVCLMIAIVVKLYVVQVYSHEKYSQIAFKQHTVEKSLSSSRGEVFLQNQKDIYPAGVNKEYYMAYLSPRDVPEEEMITAGSEISELLDIPYEDVMVKMSKRNDVHEVLKRKIDIEEKRILEEKNITGLHFLPEYYRFYPGGELAAHVIGFVGSNGTEYVGRYGIEAYLNDEMNGDDGYVLQKRDARGGWLTHTERTVEEKKDGTDVYLTIDYTVQYEVERILKDAVEKFDADSGSVIVMQPKLGRILSMANYPTFAPNHFNEVEDVAVFRNNAISDEYESGSVFKPITMAMGLDNGKIRPDSTYVDTGSVKAAEYTIKNSKDKKYGLQTMTQVLEESINTGVIHVEKQLGNKVFKDYVERFGFGKQTGINLPAEANGNIRNLNYLKRHVEFYTASFGQGITMTPLQIATAYSALANGGYLMKPQIIDKKVYSDGLEEVVEPYEIHRVISEEASQDIGKMLRSVVVNGHGKRADVPGYLIGGKTGTAQVAKANEKGYDDEQTIGTFAGYGPINDPQFAIVVRIDNPKKVIWAESSAAPTFGRIMKYLLDYYNIAPTEEIKK